MARYSGKRAVILGGTAGIGLAIAKRLVEGGAEVSLTGDDPARAAAELGSSCAHVAGPDPVGPAEGRALAAAVGERFGRVDYLFVNTSVGLPAPTEEVTEAEYDEQFALNTKGAYFAVQALLPLIGHGGAIVFTTCAEHLPGLGVYAMTKSALWSFAQSLSAELLDRGIRVNAVAPGSIAGVPLPPEDRAGDSRTPMGRSGSAEEVARAALFLAADATFTTGARLPVDGGLARFGP
ncbi:SDR family oxidoreductase [Bailinhaonella thermotolerans]|uniref:SDR family oxidoreductase n=1 Tax=Bailinhaonella thermotolerans TaxID=1070861 RepID=A0A3A4BD06_9ACTN|nr:SDR family oxidoreductase [Bailinhaonella thermotolerans]RJL32088.1 SDR family oxidoreductase [Bailinhaonella thermotolerans]